MTWLLRSVLLSLILYPIVLSDSMEMSDSKDIQCLANIMWHEARGESQRGQLMVASVVLNRATKRNKSICEVMSEPKQFSWYAKHSDIVELSVMDKQLALVYNVYMKHKQGQHEDHTKGASHFAVKHVRNAWTRVFKRTLTEGKLSFYRETKSERN